MPDPHDGQQNLRHAASECHVGVLAGMLPSQCVHGESLVLERIIMVVDEQFLNVLPRIVLCDLPNLPPYFTIQIK